MIISVVCPVFNEADYIHGVMDFFSRSLPAEKELLIIDGGSHDGTREQVKAKMETDHRIRLIDNPDKYVPFALNAAIPLCKGEIIVRLDAHTIYEDDYFTRIIDCFNNTGTDIAGGPMRAKGTNDLQKAVAIATSTPFGVGDSSFHDENHAGFVDSVYLGAWKRKIFDVTGLFDTDMLRNQDDEFHYRAREKGFKIYLDPLIRSYYFPGKLSKLFSNNIINMVCFKPLVLKKVKSGVRLRHLIPAMFVIYLVSIPISFLFIYWIIPLLLYFMLDVYFSLKNGTGLNVKINMMLVYPILHLAYGLGFIKGQLIVFSGRKPGDMIMDILKSGKVVNVLLWSIAFLFPFMPKFISVIIILLVISLIAQGILIKNFQWNFKERLLNAAVCYYMFHALGLLWSDNLLFGIGDLQTKLSLFIFPFLLTANNIIKKETIYRALIAFCLGCVAALLICMIRAIYFFPQNGFEGFFYQKLSPFIHPGYFAMYINFSICFLIYEIVFDDQEFMHPYRRWLFPVAVFLSIGLMLLSSKAGILILLISLVVTILFLIIRKKSRKILVSLIFILTGALLFSLSTPEIFKRWREMGSTIAGQAEELQGHTTGERLKTWEGAVKLIGKHPLKGVGTGDVKDEMIKNYNNLGFTDVATKRLNAHNQFLQSGVALGIVAILLLLYICVSAGISHFRNGNYIGLSFISIITIYAMIESIFEVQAGVIFFSFFYCLLNLLDSKMNTEKGI